MKRDEVLHVDVSGDEIDPMNRSGHRDLRREHPAAHCRQRSRFPMIVFGRKGIGCLTIH